MRWVDDFLVAVVLLGALPLLAAAFQYLVVGLHAFRNHYDECGEHLPTIAVLIPAWNEALVLRTTIEQFMQMEYPEGRLRVYVVDDASTDDTPAVMARLVDEFGDRVHHLRREQGGQGKSHTLNHGLAVVLEQEDWAEAVLITDADVVFERDAMWKMARHLADPTVGAVSGYIKEGSAPGNGMNKFVAYEYITAQAASRRAQNAFGVMACLAGGAQLHSRANLVALGGRIDTASLAEDTITTFHTQMQGRRCIFDPHAVSWAEEPGSVLALWKQRLRWARGNVQVTYLFKDIWLKPWRRQPLSGVTFGLNWFITWLQPVLMLLSSLGLVVLFFTAYDDGFRAFRVLWILNALCYVFVTSYSMMLDPQTARRTWFQALTFPGFVSTIFIVYSCFPGLFDWLSDQWTERTDLALSHSGTKVAILLAYVWVSACMVAAYGLKRLDQAGFHRTANALVYVVGYGSLLCAITFNGYIAEARGAEQRWDKTEKTGKIVVPT
jgi:cellulose synthase/poly-beta-1,6-N-acetylglucosamine synthase-like glycosyltransferase